MNKLLVLLLFSLGLASAQEFDIVIRGGRIVDGTGNPSWIGDVGIRDGKIVGIGRLPGQGTTTIDAKGLIVAPGFIDIHNHSDYTLLVDGNAESMIRQGVTSMILGEGGSAAPIGGKQESKPQNADWKDLKGYFAKLLKQGISTNVGTYVGSSQIWTYVHGENAGPPSPNEVIQMQALVREAMQQGALGVASSLSGPPGSWIDTATLIAMCKIAGQYGGLYSTHMRTEGKGVFESVDEALEIGRKAGVPVDIIHIKLADHTLWGQMPELISKIQQARANGEEVTANVYPYRAGQNNLATIIPPWAHEGGTAAMLQRLKDPSLRPRLVSEIEHGIPGSNWYDHYTATGSWEGMLLVSLSNPDYKKFEGKRMNEVIQALGGSPIDVLFRILEDNRGSVPTIYFHHDENDMRYALRQPFVSIGSDGTAVKPEGPLSKDHPHPRYYGTFPRVLGRYVRDEHILTLEDAIRKMTSANAAKIHVYDRGLLRPGMWADVTVFDAAKIIDNATWEQPHQYASGVNYVLVNGKVVIDNGQHTGAHPGMILYGPGKPDDDVAVVNTDRSTAEWAIRAGGEVWIDGKPQPVRDIADLPAGDFHLTGIDLVGTTIDPKELSHLRGLQDVRELLLPGPIFNPFAGSQLDANNELRALATMPKLEKLSVSLHFLTNVNVQDKGLSLFKNLTGMREMRLAQTKVKGPGLETFVNLRYLDLNDTPFTDFGTRYLQRLKKLQYLSLRDTLLTDAGAKNLAGLRELTSLDLYGTKVTDEGVRLLAGLNKLERLNLLGAAVTDDGMETLAGFHDLRDLNLYRTQITNTGLDKLKGLKHLAELDVRYTRVTRGGVDALRAALPNCRIQFEDSSVETTGAEQLRQSRPSGSGERAIADWIARLGGKATFAGEHVSEVVLTRTPIIDAQLAFLAPLSHLERLDLQTTEVGELGAQFLGKLTSLRELNLNHTMTSDKSLASLKGLSNLKRLVLTNTYVEGPGLAALADLPIEEIDLQGAPFGDAGLRELGHWKALRTLKLSYTNVSDQGLEQIAGLSSLRYLDVSADDIGDDGLARLKPLTGLTELLLNYARLTDAGVANLAGLTSLEHLEMARTRLSDAGLASICKLTKLKRLNLNYTSVTDKGIVGLPELVDLRLDSAGVTDAGLEPLEKMQTLKYLNLYHTLVTEKAFEDLKKALPKCQIVFDRDSSLPNRRHS
jgi:N-acyl-D-aspartate/D-glutamate deacylase/Leucine-rich repeat (LRR) protein